MVELSNQTTIINPSILAINREANILCPRVIFNDIELTLTLKLLETKLYNLCLEQNSFKLLVSDLFIAELMERKERTARNYITKLIKLGKIKKLACKEKGKYYLVLNYNGWMQLSEDEIISIDENFNLISNIDFSLVSTVDGAAIDDTAIASSFSLVTEAVAEQEAPLAIENQRVEVETISIISTKLLETQQELSQTEEAESFYNQLNENQEDELLSLCFVVEEIWQKNGKLDEVKKAWTNNSTPSEYCLENFVTEQILLQIKLDYTAALKELLANNCSVDNDEVKNAAIFSLTTRYEKSKQLEQIEAIEQVEAKPATEYLLQAVGQSHPISVNQIATNTKTLANSCQNIQAQKIDLFNNKINLANFCQDEKLVLSKEELNNAQQKIEERKKHILKGFEENQTHPLSLVKSKSTKSNEDWEQVGGLAENNLASLIQAAIKNVEMAKSCQNDAQVAQTTTELTEEEVGKTLPNNSTKLEISEISEISEPLKQEQPKRVFYPGSLKIKQPLLKNYFWNIS